MPYIPIISIIDLGNHRNMWLASRKGWDGPFKWTSWYLGKLSLIESDRRVKDENDISHISLSFAVAIPERMLSLLRLSYVQAQGIRLLAGYVYPFYSSYVYVYIYIYTYIYIYILSNVYKTFYVVSLMHKYANKYAPFGHQTWHLEIFYK